MYRGIPSCGVNIKCVTYYNLRNSQTSKFCHCPKLTCEGMKYFVEECENLVGFVVNT